MRGLILDEEAVWQLGRNNPYVHVLMHKAVTGGPFLRLHGDCLSSALSTDQLSILATVVLRSSGRITTVPMTTEIYPVVLDTMRKHDLDGVGAALAAWQAEVLEWPILAVSPDRVTAYRQAGVEVVELPLVLPLST